MSTVPRGRPFLMMEVNILWAAPAPITRKSCRWPHSEKSRRGKDSGRAKVDMGRGADITDAIQLEGAATSKSTSTHRKRLASSMSTSIRQRGVHQSHEVTILDKLTGTEAAESQEKKLKKPWEIFPKRRRR